MEVKFAQPIDPGAIRHSVEELGFKDASVQTYGAEESTRSSSASSASPS